MELNPVTLGIIAVFLYPLIKGFIMKFSSDNYKKSISGIVSDIVFIIAIYLGFQFSKNVFIEEKPGIYKKIFDLIPLNLTEYIQNSKFILYLVVMPIFIYLIYKVISYAVYLIFRISVFPLLDAIEDRLDNKGGLFKRILGIIFQMPRALIYVLVLTLALNLYSNFIGNNKINTYLQQSSVYNRVCTQVILPITKSSLAKELPSVINNSFKIEIKENSSNGVPSNGVSYNGISLDQGVKSNEAIDSYAKKITAQDTSSLNKAKSIYSFIGKNIEYDSVKANAVMNNDFSSSSGAIPTYNSKKGICFDYSCLFVAMCRANNIKVRLVTGYGFNGVSWIGHAWNQVYIQEENRWINVDCTFYKGGNYFDSTRFDDDHKQDEIAGEW